MLSYNSKKLLKQFLPKIINTIPKAENVQLYVVDNASVDQTWEYLDEYFPEVNKIRLDVNKGFTNGYVASLSKIKADYYVLISSDIEVEGNWLLAPIEIMENDRSVAAVQPKIKSYHNRELFEYAGAAGGFIDYLGLPFCRGRLINHLEEDLGQYDSEIEIFWASGACMFLRADLYHQAGGLDNSFFAHMEEIDLCWRLKNMGYKIKYCPSSTVYHMGGFIISYGSPLKVFRNHRNNLIMLIKNMPAQQLLWKLPLRIVLDWLIFFKMLLEGQLKASVGIPKAHWQLIIYAPQWVESRATVQKLVSEPNTTGMYKFSIIWKVLIKGVKKFSNLIP